MQNANGKYPVAVMQLCYQTPHNLQTAPAPAFLWHIEFELELNYIESFELRSSQVVPQLTVSASWCLFYSSSLIVCSRRFLASYKFPGEKKIQLPRKVNLCTQWWRKDIKIHRKGHHVGKNLNRKYLLRIFRKKVTWFPCKGGIQINVFQFLLRSTLCVCDQGIISGACITGIAWE